jgi:hypothetical protein
MCGYARKRQSQKGLDRDLSNFQTIAVLRFRIRNKPVNRGMHSPLSVKAEDGCLDLASKEEESPAGLVDVPHKIGSKVCDCLPAPGIRLAYEHKGSRQKRAVFDQNGSSFDYVHDSPSRSEARLVQLADFLLLHTIIFALFRPQIGFSLGRLLLVEVFRLRCRPLGRGCPVGAPRAETSTLIVCCWNCGAPAGN